MFLFFAYNTKKKCFESILTLLPVYDQIYNGKFSARKILLEWTIWFLYIIDFEIRYTYLICYLLNNILF